MEWPQNKGEKKEKEMPKITLHFLRHSIKENAPEKQDKDILLSPEGRELATKKFDGPLNMRFSHVEGSSRVRTHETATTAATQDAQVDPGSLGIGKVRMNELLDFYGDESEEYGKRFYKEYADGNLMTFLVHESDSFARECADTDSSTYSRMAANIAKIIYRNYEVASRGAAILEQSQNPKNETNDFERILATHATIQESFLLKLVEKIKGTADRDRLLSLIGENGFGYTEGFDVIISKERNEEKIRITYGKGEYVFDEIVPAEVIREIVEEGV